jgi:Heterokaryon incompatibility protein (HET)
MATSTQQTLCERCSEINLEDLFRSPDPDSSSPAHEHYVEALILGEITPEWSSSSCPLCQFFFFMIPDNKKGYVDRQFAIFRKKNISNYASKASFLSSSCLVDVHTASTRTEFFKHVELQELPHMKFARALKPPRLLDQRRVDYGPLRLWCTKIQELNETESERAGADELPLCVIDCSTRQLVRFSAGCRYVALSYVSGAAPAQQPVNDDDSLPGHLPATVEDAIMVVKELGLCFLWVDRYCLIQGNAAEFQSQLNSMGGIYRNAVATIIAAAGSDADYGLPGVGNKSRIKQPYVTIGDCILYSTMTDPRKIIRESVWMTRAWTFQEAVFSRNWIVFTDEQVYYQRSQKFIEFYQPSWKVASEMSPDGGLGEWKLLCPLRHLVDNPKAIHEQISNYTERRLTYQSDALNGISGILKRYGDDSYPLNHYFGIPIMEPSVLTKRSCSMAEVFLMGLCWKARISGARRLEFPSWSWTGWQSVYSQHMDPVNEYGLQRQNEIQVELFVEQLNTLGSWEAMCYRTDWNIYENLLRQPRELHVLAPVRTIDVCKTDAGWNGFIWRQDDLQSTHHFGLSAIFSDDECSVQIEVNLSDGLLVENMDKGDLVTLKAVFIRQLSLQRLKSPDNHEENETSRFAPLLGEAYVAALLVLEDDGCATRVGMLEFRPSSSYGMQWKRKVEHPAHENATRWGSGACDMCAERVLKLLLSGQKRELIKIT